MMMHSRLLTCFLSLTLLAGSAVAQLSDDEPGFGGDSGFDSFGLGGGVPDYVEIDTYLNQDVYRPGDKVKLAVQMTIHHTVHINSDTPTADYQYPTSLDWADLPAGLTLGDIRWPKAKMMAFEFTSGEKIAVYEGTVRAFVEGEVAKSAKPGALRLKGKFAAQGCTNTVCYAPQKDDVAVTVRVVGADEEPELINEAKFATDGSENQKGHHGGDKPTQVVKNGGGSGPDGGSVPAECESLTSETGWKHGLFLLYLACFGGGLALCATPCVLPLVPVTIGFFSGQSKAGGKPIHLAIAYVLGLALVYATLGTVAALSGGLFGAALQNPWVIAGMAAVLIALATSMFGLWNLTLPSFLTGKMGGARSGPLGAAIMGGAMGIIAAPCVGPFVVTLLTYVAKLGAELPKAQAALTGGSLFFVLALGLGTPFFLVGLGVASFQPGEWMENVKKVFGFLIIGVALWFLRPILPSTVFVLLMVALGVAFAVFCFLPIASRGAPKLAAPLKALGVLALAGVGYFGWSSFQGPDHGRAFTPYSHEALAAATASGKPVVIDFMAEWCTVCKEIEHVTFPAPEVQEAFEGFELLQADLTDDKDPLVQELYKNYQIVGLPTIVFIDSAGKEVRPLRLSKFEKAADFASRLRCVESFGATAQADASSAMASPVVETASR
ncbi:MAG: cytochrome c biogenesis protein CcdA [Acidobacteriota bacterium]